MFDLKAKIKERKPKIGDTLFIAIDGHGGSGKSTLADILSGKLDATLIRTDDFASWENPFNWYTDVIEKVFKPILNGAKELHYQPTSWWENHNPELVTKSVTPVMILEGVSSSRKEFRDYISLSIFVNTPREICLTRGVERDLQSNTRKSEEELSKMWKTWFAEEDVYMRRDNPKDHVDIVVSGTRPVEEQIQF